jgi:hypothetical protein
VLGEGIKAMSDPTGPLGATLEPLKFVFLTLNPVSS